MFRTHGSIIYSEFVPLFHQLGNKTQHKGISLEIFDRVRSETAYYSFWSRSMVNFTVSVKRTRRWQDNTKYVMWWYEYIPALFLRRFAFVSLSSPLFIRIQTFACDCSLFRVLWFQPNVIILCFVFLDSKLITIEFNHLIFRVT